MKRILGILPFLLLLLPAPTHAQHAQARSGFGISVGLGAGNAAFCNGCDELSSTQLSGYLRLGGYLRPAVFLGGESNGWVGGIGDYDGMSLGAVMGVVQWYPAPSQGLYLKGGIGYSYAAIDFDFTASGLAGSIGAGYDFRIARNFALTPYVNYLNQFGGSYTYSGGGETGLDAAVHLFQFGLGFTWF